MSEATPRARRAPNSPPRATGFNCAKAIEHLNKIESRPADLPAAREYTHDEIAYCMGYSSGMVTKILRGTPPNHNAAQALLGLYKDVFCKQAPDLWKQHLLTEDQKEGGSFLDYLGK